MPPRSWALLGGDHDWRVGLVFAGCVFTVGEKGGQCFLFAAVGVGIADVGSRRFGRPERLGQPAGAVEQPFGLLRHVRLLQMVDELRRLLAVRLAHRFEDTRLGDAAEIILDRWPPTGVDHVEPDGPCEAVSLGETMLDAVNGETGTAIAIAFLVERVDAERDAVRQQCGPAGVVQCGEPIPERGFILRHVGLPGIVPFGDRLGGRAFLEVGRLDREEHVPHRRFETVACRCVLEGVEAEFVQERRHRDMRIVRHGIPQRQRAVRGQFAKQPIRQRLNDVVLIVFRLGLAADGDDDTLNRRRVVVDPNLLEIVAVFLTGLDDWSFILGANIATIDLELAVVSDADKHPGPGDVGRIEDVRSRLERLKRGFDLAEALVDLVGQFVGIFVLRLKLIELGAQRFTRGTFVVGEIGRYAVELAQAVVVTVGEVHCDLDPFPALGGDMFRVGLQFFGDKGFEKPDIFKPATVVLLEEIAHDDTPAFS